MNIVEKEKTYQITDELNDRKFLVEVEMSKEKSGNNVSIFFYKEGCCDIDFLIQENDPAVVRQMAKMLLVASNIIKEKGRDTLKDERR